MPDKPAEKKIPEIPVDAQKAIQDAGAQVAEVTGDEIIYITASTSRKKYEIRPCSLKEMPRLASLLSKVQKIMEDEAKAGKSEYEIIMNESNGFLGTLAEIIQIGVKRAHPNKTLEEIQDEFAIQDFPRAYEKILGLNDFLAGMGRVQKIV